MTQRQRTLCRQGTACLVVVLTLAACGPSPEDLVEQLTSGTGDVQMVRQELMLRRAQAVAPLLRALSYTEEGAGRTQIVSVLVSLSARLDDARIPPVLAQCLIEDSEPSVRSLVARLAGLHRRVDLAPALLAALEDSVADVRYEAAVSLHAIGDRLTPEQELRLEARTHELATDADPRVRLEGQARLERTVNRLGTDAKRKLLEGDSAAAESLYVQAIQHHPGTKRGHYRLARFYYDGGHTTRGLAYLQEQGMLLDVPHLAAAPNMDGLVDDEVWQTAARTDSFFSFSMEHTATPPCSERTRVLIGYTDDALYIAFRGHDANIAGLVAETESADAERVSGRGGLPAVGLFFVTTRLRCLLMRISIIRSTPT
jgi:hypothetical protein